MAILPVLTTKPPGITCPDWVAYEPGKKRCAYYQPPEVGAPGATCSLGAHFLCVEWVLANQATLPPETVSRIRESVEARQRKGAPAEASHAPPKAPPAVPAPAPRDLFGAPLPAPLAPPPTRAGLPPRALPPLPYKPAKEIPAEDVASLERQGLELELACEGMPAVFLVPVRTGADRVELTYREAATLRLIVDCLPGAKLVGLSKGTQRPEPVIEVERPRGDRFERTPEGTINNCALANTDLEKNCQICEGSCPDRDRFTKMSSVVDPLED